MPYKATDEKVVPGKGPVQHRNLAEAWPLAKDITYLNHGSFGACTRRVLDEQLRYRQQLESDPHGFMVDALAPLWAGAIEGLAALLNADPAGLALIPNSTTGVNTVLGSIPLRAGSEIMLTDHGYQACRNAVDAVCERTGAVPRVVVLPFTASPDEVLERMVAAVSGRTVLALIDTVASPTAYRMPFERLTAELQQRGVDVLVDGSHGAGLLPLDLTALGAAYFTGNCHKWLCTPKGSGFLHVREDRLDVIKPLVVSHGHGVQGKAAERFRAAFDWQGTLDPSPWLCIPAAITELSTLCAGGWEGLWSQERLLVAHARKCLSDALETEALTPTEATAAMLSVALPRGPDRGPSGLLPQDSLSPALWQRYRIRVPVMPWPAHGVRYLRVSCAPYNAESDIDRLVDALRELRAKGGL